MNREFLVRVVRSRLVKAFGRGVSDPAAISESVVDGIEIALELEQEGVAGVPPVPPTGSASPLLPSAISSAAVSFSPKDLSGAELGPPPDATPSNPAEAPAEPIILVASESAAVDRYQTPISRLKRAAAPRSVDSFREFLEQSTPAQLSIQPGGRSELKPIPLTRSIDFLPATTPRSPNQFRLSYLHPDFDAAMSVSYVFSVETSTVEEIDKALSDIETHAREVYRPRPRFIEPVRPPQRALTLENGVTAGEAGTPADQDRWASIARQGEAAVQKEIAEMQRRG